MIRRPSGHQAAAALACGIGVLVGAVSVPPQWKPIYFALGAVVVMVVGGLGAEGRSRAGPAITEGNHLKKIP